MMRRRASPSARTTRTAPTAPASRSTATALVCLARSRRMRGQSPGTAPARAWKVDRSVAQGRRTEPLAPGRRRIVGRPSSRSPWRAWLALLPGVAFWDTGELQTVGPLLGTAHPTGFPTYVLLGWLASVVLQPFGDPAFRMNLLSALCLGRRGRRHRRPRPSPDRSVVARESRPASGSP